MANQAIALQARAPQGNFLAPAIQQGAQMINMMRQQQALDRQTAAQEQSMKLQMAGEGRAAAEAARAAELQPFKVDEARNKSISDAIKVGMEFNKYINMSAADANSPEDFRAFAADIAANPLFQSDIFKNGLSQVVASIPNDPARFAEWKRQTGLKTIEKDKLYKKELIKQETADGTRQIAVDPYGDGGASVVPGSEVNLGQEVTYITLADGRRVAMPKRLPAGGGGIVGGVRGGGATGGVQIGQPIAGSGKPAAAAKPEKPLTQAQAKATGYAMRAQEADEDLAAIKQFSPSAIASKRYAEDIPVFGALTGPLVNRALSENDQLVEQAQRNFVNAVLRQDSGAAINAGEWANAQRQYFEQPNDKPAVIAQKAKNRATAIEALKIGAGAGIKPPSAADTKKPADAAAKASGGDKRPPLASFKG